MVSVCKSLPDRVVFKASAVSVFWLMVTWIDWGSESLWLASPFSLYQTV